MWVSRTGYSPGTRHWSPEGVTRVWTKVVVKPGTGTYRYFRDTALAACGRTLRGGDYSDGYEFTNENGKRGHTTGNLSSKKMVNLFQHNLCGRCMKAYVKAHPEIQEAVDRIQRGLIVEDEQVRSD